VSKELERAIAKAAAASDMKELFRLAAKYGVTIRGE